MGFKSWENIGKINSPQCNVLVRIWSILKENLGGRTVVEKFGFLHREVIQGVRWLKSSGFKLVFEGFPLKSDL